MHIASVPADISLEAYLARLRPRPRSIVPLALYLLDNMQNLLSLAINYIEDLPLSAFCELVLL